MNESHRLLLADFAVIWLSSLLSVPSRLHVVRESRRFYQWPASVRHLLKRPWGRAWAVMLLAKWPAIQRLWCISDRALMGTCQMFFSVIGYPEACLLSDNDSGSGNFGFLWGSQSVLYFWY